MAKNSLFEELKEGLEDAIKWHKGEKKLKTTKISIEPLPEIKGKEIKKIRDKFHITQNIFSKILGVSAKTVEAWESGANIPNGPAQRILNAIQKNPNLISNFGWSVVEEK